LQKAPRKDSRVKFLLSFISKYSTAALALAAKLPEINANELISHN
jgi:hypothetical protein